MPARSAPALAGAGLAAVAVSAWMLGSDDRADDLGEALSRPPWVAGTATAVLLLLATVHYLCAALALRAVSSPQLPLRAVTGVQLAAAATNRVVPSGFGGVAVNLRYLVRAGIPEGAAVSALAALAVVGAATDTAYAARSPPRALRSAWAGPRASCGRSPPAGSAPGRRTHGCWLWWRRWH